MKHYAVTFEQAADGSWRWVVTPPNSKTNRIAGAPGYDTKAAAKRAWRRLVVLVQALRIEEA